MQRFFRPFLTSVSWQAWESQEGWEGRQINQKGRSERLRRFETSGRLGSSEKLEWLESLYPTNPAANPNPSLTNLSGKVGKGRW